MQTTTRSLILFALAVVAGALIMAGGPSMAVAQSTPSPSAAAPSDLAAKVMWLEKMVKYLQGEVSTLKLQIKQQNAASSGGAAGAAAAAALSPKALNEKILALEKKLEGHTHEYQLEGRASDGTIRAVPQDQFPGSGLNSTGGARIGKAIIH